MDITQLIETWHINDRINLYLLAAIPAEHLTSGLSSKGRTAGEQFAHIHNVRLMWVKAALPDVLAGQTKIEKELAADKALIQRLLPESAAAIVKILENAAASGGRVKGFKPHVTAFVGYLTAHDAHHRSQIIIALKQSGHPLDKKILYGIWEWGSR